MRAQRRVAVAPSSSTSTRCPKQFQFNIDDCGLCRAPQQVVAEVVDAGIGQRDSAMHFAGGNAPGYHGSADKRRTCPAQATCSPVLMSHCKARARRSDPVQRGASSPISHRSRLEVQRTVSMVAAGTTSIHTVCQIPVVRGYQMECGSSFQSCLPRGFSRSAGSSFARTIISCGSPASRCVGDFEREGRVAPSWWQRLDAVDPYGGRIVHCAEVQHQPLAGRQIGFGHLQAIPDGAVEARCHQCRWPLFREQMGPGWNGPRLLQKDDAARRGGRKRSPTCRQGTATGCGEVVAAGSWRHRAGVWYPRKHPWG